MKKLFLIATLSLAPALALASGHADVHFALPENPTMAVVQPGVQVLVGLDDEVFYSNHHYWLRREGAWYRARHHGDAFVYVEGDQVPSVLLGFAPGQYLHYHPDHGGHHDGDGTDDRYDGVYDDGYGHHGSGGHGGHNGC